jgi:hypothetical protein
VEYAAQDIIDTLTSQRNAALDEIVRQSAIIRALERELNNLKEGEKNGPAK